MMPVSLICQVMVMTPESMHQSPVDATDEEVNNEVVSSSQELEAEPIEEAHICNIIIIQ